MFGRIMPVLRDLIVLGLYSCGFRCKLEHESRGRGSVHRLISRG